MVRKLLSLFLPILFFVASGAFGEEVHRTYRLLLLYDGYKPEIMPGSLLASLMKSTDLISVESDLKPDAPLAEIQKEARRNGCDLVLSVRIDSVQEKSRLTVFWSFSSPWEDHPRFEGKTRKDIPSANEITDLFWLFLMEPLQKTLVSKPDLPPPLLSKLAKLTIKAKAGTKLSGLKGSPVYTDSQGIFQTILAVPTPLVIQGSHPNYRSQILRVFVRDEMEVELPQTIMPRFSLDIEVQNAAFPSLGFRWNFFPGVYFARFGFVQYWGGLNFFQQSPKTGGYYFSPTVVSRDLFQLQFGLGGYWTPPDELFRFYYGLDAGLRFMTYKIVRVDTVVPWQFQPYLGAEVRVIENMSLYCELGPVFYLAPDNVFLNASVPTKSSTHVMAWKNFPLAWEMIPQTKLGLRWSF